MLRFTDMRKIFSHGFSLFSCPFSHFPSHFPSSLPRFRSDFQKKENVIFCLSPSCNSVALNWKHDLYWFLFLFFCMLRTKKGVFSVVFYPTRVIQLSWSPRYCTQFSFLSIMLSNCKFFLDFSWSYQAEVRHCTYISLYHPLSYSSLDVVLRRSIITCYLDLRIIYFFAGSLHTKDFYHMRSVTISLIWLGNILFPFIVGEFVGNIRDWEHFTLFYDALWILG